MRKCLSDDLGRFAEVGELQAAQKPHFVSAHQLCPDHFRVWPLGVSDIPHKLARTSFCDLMDVARSLCSRSQKNSMSTVRQVVLL
jgi:hypothetical protein